MDGQDELYIIEKRRKPHLITGQGVSLKYLAHSAYRDARKVPLVNMTRRGDICGVLATSGQYRYVIWQAWTSNLRQKTTRPWTGDWPVRTQSGER